MSLRITRRRFALYGAAALTTAVAIDGFGLEPYHPVAKPMEIQLARLPESFDGFRIAQISDIHFGPYIGRDNVARAVRLAQPFQPDLVALTGDFVSHPFRKPNGAEGAHFAEPCADVLSEWKGVPMVAILGNHDHWNDPELVAAALRERDIRVLRNESFALERGKDRVWLAGIDDAYENKADLPRTLTSVPQSEVTVLLAHEPDYADYAARFSVDLQLSGHSHGGQVRVPGYGPVVLPRMGRKYHTGLNWVGRLQVYTSHGIGVVNPPVRFKCPPEVTLITLRKSPT